RLRVLFHSPSPSIQRRSVSAGTCSWSSLARCSAANVGPKRVFSSPLYFSRTSFRIFRRSLAGRARLDWRPALPCFRAAAPPSWYFFHNRFALRSLVRLTAAASFSRSSPALTRASTPTLCSSLLLKAVLPNPTSSPGGGLQIKGTFLSRSLGDIIKVA